MGFYNRNSGYIGHTNNSPYGLSKANTVTSANATTFLLNANSTPAYTDASTNNSTVTPIGLPSTSNSTPFGNGWSTFFDGTGDYVTAPYTAVGSSNFCFETWAYFNDVSSRANYLFIQADSTVSTNSNLGVGVVSLTSGRLYFFWNSGSTQLSITTANNTLSSKVWTHIACTRSGDTFTAYINGVAVGTTTSAVTINTLSSTPSNRIGQYQNEGNTTIMSGYLSNLRLVIGSPVYTSNFIPPNTNLTAITNTVLLSCQSGMHVDNSPNNYQLTPFGDARPIVFSPFDRESFNLSATSSSSVSATAAISLATSTSPLTLEAWVKISGNTAGCIISDSFTGGSNAVSFVLGLNDGALNGSTVAGNKPWFGFYSGSTWTGNVLVSTVGIPFNQWVHIAGVFTGSTCKIYVNGKLIASGGPSTWTTAASDAVFIGRRWDTSSSPYFNGTIAEARISKELVYADEFTPPTSPLTAGVNTALLVACDGAIIDKSSNRYVMVPAGQVWQMKDTPYTYSPTVSFTGQSAFFNGTTSYLNVPANANFSFGTGDFTVECWVNYSAVSNTNGKIIADTRPTSTNGSYWVLGVSNTGIVQFISMTTGGTTVSDTQARPNQWVHIAVTRQGTSLRLFANGIQVATATDSSNISSSDLNIGKNAFSSGATDTFWNGHISNLRIVKGTALYTANFVVPTAALTTVSGTSFLMSVNGRFVGDLTANNLPVVSYNNVSNANKSPNTQINNSLYFDGTGDYVTIPFNPELTLGTADFTIEFWLYRINAADIGLYDQRLSSNPVVPTIYYLNSTGTIRFYTGAADRISGGFVPQRGWCHVAACRINGVTRLYLDGNQVGANYTDANDYLANPVQLGQFGNTFGAGQLNGYMSGVRVIKGIGLYTGTFTPDNLNTSAVIPASSFVLDNSYKTIQDISSVGSVAYRTTSNSITQNNFTPYWPDGQWSNYFNGSSYLTVANNTAFDLGTGDCTIEAWVYVTSLSAVATFLSTFPASGTISGYSFSVDTTGAISLDTWVSGTEQYVLASNNKLSANTWAHIAYTRSSGTSKLFVNGVSCTFTGSISQAINSGGNSLKIGQQGYTGYVYPFNGYTSNIRIIKGTALYTSDFTPSTTPLTAISGTSLLTCQSNRFKDNSSNNFAITVTGTPSTLMTNPFVTPSIANTSAYGASVYGNGSDSITAIGDYTLLADFTIEGWMYLTNYSANRTVMTVGNEATGRIAFFVNTSGALAYDVYAVSTTSLGGTVPLNSWFHVAYVRSGSTITAYINGIATGTTGTRSGTLGNTSNLIVSGSVLGYSADMRLTRGRAVYTGNFTPPTTPLSTTQTFSSQVSYYGSGMITNIEKQTDFERNSVPGLAGKFFNGTWRTALINGNIGTFPLSSVNDSSAVTSSGGLPSDAHRYGVNRYDYIYYLSVGDSYGFIAVGYFKPPVTGTYTFSTSSDDNSGVWIGTTAVLPTGRTSANALVNNNLDGTSGQGNTKRSGTITLYEGVWYPIRIGHEEGGGGDNLYFTWAGPNDTETSDLSQYFRTPVASGVLIGHYV